MDRATRPHSARVSCDLMKPCVAYFYYRCIERISLLVVRFGSFRNRERVPLNVRRLEFSVSGFVRTHTYLDCVRDRNEKEKFLKSFEGLFLCISCIKTNRNRISETRYYFIKLMDKLCSKVLHVKYNLAVQLKLGCSNFVQN